MINYGRHPDTKEMEYIRVKIQPLILDEWATDVIVSALEYASENNIDVFDQTRNDMLKIAKEIETQVENNNKNYHRKISDINITQHEKSLNDVVEQFKKIQKDNKK